MENSRKKYRVATPEEKENIMEKLAPSAREKVKEIYRCLPTADDMKKAKTPEEKREILRKIMLSLFRQEKEAHRLTGTKERHRLTCTLESTDTAALMRDISASIKARGRHRRI